MKNTLAFAGRGLDPVRLAGNHVVVATGGTHALYARLVPGTVAVTRGSGNGSIVEWLCDAVGPSGA